ncbi:hypothetical protein CHU93_11285 [Sandarakinorhabdus cyanobacteriorum]|uniref:DUF2948 domain-containing protein n=1 Tax=Sandarakinorhabdus cyanobacteriorum TaxID=1981098 RepID=A0A255YCW8_9SPHN|nr:hypothetical protein CHU93_11285 [Sandarakinorhabdus cyanobacteriorum]
MADPGSQSGASRLALLGQEPDDIATFSALLQDATLRLADVGYDRKARRLACLVNRFRREVDAPSRIRCAFRIETVGAVQRAGWPADPEAVTAILSLDRQGDWLVITCAGGIAIRARVEVIELVLEDMGEPWATTRVPSHD